VDQETIITLNKINPNLIKSTYGRQETDKNQLITAFDFNPDNFSFWAPIKIYTQNFNYTQGYLTILYQISLDSELGCCSVRHPRYNT